MQQGTHASEVTLGRNLRQKSNHSARKIFTICFSLRWRIFKLGYSYEGCSAPVFWLFITSAIRASWYKRTVIDGVK